MSTHPLASTPAPRDLLVNVPRLVSAYYTYKGIVNLILGQRTGWVSNLR
jgi:hypothetical protein